MNPSQLAVLLSIGLFAAVMLCLEAGFRIGHWRFKRGDTSFHEGTGAIEAAVFALLGLLLGFSFAGGLSRLDARRELIVREANAIGTAYLRLDLLPAESQSEMRQLFAAYVDARLRAYEQLQRATVTEEEFARAEKIQQTIWGKAIALSRTDPTQNTARLLLPALNDMIDVTTDRNVALHTHLPPLIFSLLLLVALVSGILAGYSLAKRGSRSIFHMLLYAAVIAATVYTVVDLDNPRSGLIRLQAADNAMTKLRDSIR
jgi:hypothetical protein